MRVNSTETFSTVYLYLNIQTQIRESMSEENLESSLPTIKIDLVDQRLHSLEKMFTSFMETSGEDRNKTSMVWRMPRLDR